MLFRNMGRLVKTPGTWEDSCRLVLYTVENLYQNSEVCTRTINVVLFCNAGKLVTVLGGNSMQLKKMILKCYTFKHKYNIERKTYEFFDLNVQVSRELGREYQVGW